MIKSYHQKQTIQVESLSLSFSLSIYIYIKDSGLTDKHLHNISFYQGLIIMCRDLHGTPRKADCMWPKPHSVWDAFEVYCWTGHHRYRLLRSGFAWCRFTSRHHSGNLLYIYIYIYFFFICDLVINLSIFPQVMLLMSSI